MQTILGSTGVIGQELAKILPEYTDKVRLVSRDPVKVNSSDEIMSADLLNKEQADAAVKGSDVVYLTVGLPYKLKAWQEQWPVLMENVIEACRNHNARFVFFSNVYPYGLVKVWMTEDTPIAPNSKKGEVRAQVETMIWKAVDKGDLKAIIARSADFYGPGAATSAVNATVFEKLAKGKKPMWFVNDKVKHSLTYVPDAAKAIALLGNTEEAYDQTWHLPTDKNALTGKEIIEKVASEYDASPKYMVLKKWAFQLLGIFDPTIRESTEMLYQNKYEYLFDSSKFDNTFQLKATSYDEGIKSTAEFYKKGS